MRRFSIAALMLCAVLIPATLCMAGPQSKATDDGAPQYSSAPKAAVSEPTVRTRSSGGLADDLYLQYDLFNLGWYSMILVTDVFSYAATDDLQALVNYREVVGIMLDTFPDPETRRRYGLGILGDTLDTFDADELSAALGAYLDEVEAGVASEFGEEGLWFYQLGINDRNMGEFLAMNADLLLADVPSLSFSGRAPACVPDELAFLAGQLAEHSGQEQLVCMMGGLYDGYNGYWFAYFDFPEEE